MYKIIGGDGKEYGPVDSAQVQRWIRDNRVNGQTMAQAAGSGDWQPLSSFPEFAAQLVPSPPSLSPIPAQQPFIAPPVPSFLVPAILCTLLCCPPFGVPAIFYATQVNSKQVRGDLAGAQAASKKARTWCWICFVIGVVCNIFTAVFVERMLRDQLRF